MPKIKPPRKPRGEPAKVTIGNLELQVRNLTSRVEYLSTLNDQTCTRLRQVIAENERLGMVDSQFKSLQQVHTRMLGWQDCARETIGIDQAQITIDRVRR